MDNDNKIQFLVEGIISCEILKGNSALKKVVDFIALIDSCDEIRNFGEESM